MVRGGPGPAVEAWATAHVGTPLGRGWTLDSLVALGTVDALYAATNRNGQRVAIRLLYPSIAAVPSLRERFLEDAYIANAIDHAGTFKVFGDETTDDGQTVFVVTELIEGETLAARLARDPVLPAPVVLPLADALLGVLEAAHDRGVLHGALEPGSVFVPHEGPPKIWDFGIGKLLSDAACPRRHEDGTMVGEPAYWAPEQARGAWEEVDVQTDVFALGAVLYRTLMGVPLQRGPNEETVRIATATQPPPVIYGQAGVPVDLAGVVDGALGYRKAGRFQTFSAMRRALRSAAQELLGAGAGAWEEEIDGGRTQVLMDPRAHFAALDAAHAAAKPQAAGAAQPTLPDGVDRAAVARMVEEARGAAAGSGESIDDAEILEPAPSLEAREPVSRRTRRGHEFPPNVELRPPGAVAPPTMDAFPGAQTQPDGTPAVDVPPPAALPGQPAAGEIEGDALDGATLRDAQVLPGAPPVPREVGASAKAVPGGVRHEVAGRGRAAPEAAPGPDVDADSEPPHVPIVGCAVMVLGVLAVAATIWFIV
ncbi:MAG: protein kinase [Myxococcota bacterium]